MLKNIKNKHKSGDTGFTIIEVLIVLAIAGLILLIVFLAVPALQRSSRNTQRKNDASSVSGAVANFISNNGGTTPVKVAADPSDSSAVVVCAGTCAAADNKESAKLGYYDTANVSLKVKDASPGTPTKDTMIIDTGYSCNSTNTGLGSTNGRTAAVLYAVESSSSAVTQQCVEQ